MRSLGDDKLPSKREVNRYEIRSLSRGKSITKNSLTTLMRRLMDTESEKDLEMAEVSEVNLSQVVLDKPYDLNWFCSNKKYLAKDQEFEMRMRSRASNELVFDG